MTIYSNLQKFNEAESSDGVRFTWNTIPCNTKDLSTMKIPLYYTYSPFTSLHKAPTSPNTPTFCAKYPCQGVLNNYSTVDFENFIWCCPFCSSRNRLPSHLVDAIKASPSARPPELNEDHSVLLYEGLEGVASQPLFERVYLFMIDISQEEDSLLELKAQLISALSHLTSLCSSNSQSCIRVGLCVFGRNVSFYDLSKPFAKRLYFPHISSGSSLSSAFSALSISSSNPPSSASPSRSSFRNPLNENSEGLSSEALSNLFSFYSKKFLAKMALSSTSESETEIAARNPKEDLFEVLNPFLVPLNDASVDSLENIIMNLSPEAPPKEDAFSNKDALRKSNCAGSAFFLSSALLKAHELFSASTVEKSAESKLLAFLSGPCTVGVGKICERSFEMPIRSFRSMMTSENPFFLSASRFYETLEEFLGSRTQVDIFIGSNNQTGLLELFPLALGTGGDVFQGEGFHKTGSEEFDCSMFEQALLESIERPFMSFVNVVASKELDFLDKKKVGANEKARGVLSFLSTRKAATGGPGQSKGGNAQAEGAYVASKGSASLEEDLSSVFKKIFVSKNISGDLSLAEEASLAPGTQLHLQFQTLISFFNKKEGAARLSRAFKTTTVSIEVRDSFSAVVQGFDKLAAASHWAKAAARKLLWEGAIVSPGSMEENVSWVDRSLLAFCKDFGRRLGKDSFKDSPNRSLEVEGVVRDMCEFAFHLRRGGLIKPSNKTPDEVAYLALKTLSESSDASVLRVWPRLFSFCSRDGLEQAVDMGSVSSLKIDEGWEGANEITLESKSLWEHNVLALDAKDLIVLWKSPVTSEDPRDKSNYENGVLKAKEAIGKVVGVRKEIVVEECYEGSSKGRLLLVRLNPEDTGVEGVEKQIYTDAICLSTYLEYVKRLAEKDSN